MLFAHHTVESKMDGCVMGLHFVRQLGIANKLRALQSKE